MQDVALLVELPYMDCLNSFQLQITFLENTNKLIDQLLVFFSTSGSVTGSI